MSFQLSFPNLTKNSTRVLNVIKYVLGDIFAANLHALLLEYYKSIVRTDNNTWLANKFLFLERWKR